MEALIAIASVVTVVGAVSAILYTVASGDRQLRKLDALQAKLASRTDAPQATSSPTAAASSRAAAGVSSSKRK